MYFERREQFGVHKKITAQIKALRRFSDVEEINVQEKGQSLVQKIKSRLPLWGFGYDYDSALERIVDPDYIYVRHTKIDQDYIAFFRTLKSKYPKSKILCEFYTYPYDRDFYFRRTTWPLYIKEIMFRRKLKDYVDRIVTLSDDNEILGVKTIKTINGIDLDTVPFRAPVEHSDGIIRLISVAVMQKQHGFERLIEGLHNYYRAGGSRTILYTVVGNSVGGEVEKYKKLVQRYSLEDKVVFVGRKTGKELDELLLSSDIGICSLGLYKNKVKISSELKSREYLAIGLPMIGCQIDVFVNGGFPYYLEYPGDSSPIDVVKLIEFFDHIYSITGKEEVARSIRDFAETHVDMNRIMEPIHEFIVS